MKHYLSAILLFLILASTSNLFADVPRTINYQGRLTDLNNSPVVDGLHSITVSLYDSSTATTAKWVDNFSAATKNGYFNIVLGSGTQKLDAVDFSVQYWVGIRVDTDTEMTPRMALNSVPYALNIEVPVGCILAWHKNIKIGYVPTLPTNFVECNGQTINDAESPFNGLTTPNLNGDSSGVVSPGNTMTAQMFLRGGTMSGIGQTDQMQSHIHNVGGGNFGVASSGAVITAGASATGSSPPIQDRSYGIPRAGLETRPVNMSVVWIMRIK